MKTTMPYPTLTPAAYLEEILAPAPAGLTLLSGESGCGKTRWCQDLVTQARRLGVQAAGLLSPAVVRQGRKVGIDLVDIAGGECRRLAAERGRGAQRSPGGIETLGWQFDPQVLDWGNYILSTLPDVRLLILDEVGPLEFERGQGLTAGLAALDARQYPAACVVVRPSLLAIATQRWPWAQVIQVDGILRQGREP